MAIGKCKINGHPSTIFDVINYNQSTGKVLLEYSSGPLVGDWMLSYSCPIGDTDYKVSTQTAQIKYNHPQLNSSAKLPTTYSQVTYYEEEEEEDEELPKSKRKKPKVREEDKNLDYYMNILNS